MADQSRRDLETRVLILAPTRRDAVTTAAVLSRAGLTSVICDDVNGICREWARGAGAAVLTEESLKPDAVRCLTDMLAGEPAWSDLPFVLLTRGGVNSPAAAAAIEMLGNVVLLERPVRLHTLVSAIQAALRARRRQYQLRDLTETLEHRVEERTALADRQASQLRLLASVLTQTEQRERRRLAELLHDHLQQLLVAAKMNVAAMRNRADAEHLRSGLISVGQLLQESIEASRSLTVELSPPVLYEAGLGAALEWLRRWFHEKHGLVVDVEMDPAAEPVSDSLRILLFEAIRELLFNVVKHADADAATVRATRGDTNRIQVVVSDRGRGYDLDSTKPDATAARGFGLFSIEQRLVVLGGELTIDSTPGRGTRTIIQVPNVSEAADQEPKPATMAPDDIGPSQDSSLAAHSEKIRVLLADDHKIVRQGVAGLLRCEPDIEVVAEASDGLMAVDLAHRMRPDVVIMDINMPRLGGIEATRRLTAELPHIRVIGLSMHQEEETAQALQDAGAVAYLTKGGPSGDLITMIRTNGKGLAGRVTPSS